MVMLWVQPKQLKVSTGVQVCCVCSCQLLGKHLRAAAGLPSLNSKVGLTLLAASCSAMRAGKLLHNVLY